VVAGYLDSLGLRMNAPHGFRRSWLQWFACPSCDHRSFFSYSTGRLSLDRKRTIIEFWCPSCGSLCTLKNRWRALAVRWLFALALFAVLYWLLIGGFMEANFTWALFWIACALIVSEALSFLIGRLANQYVAIESPEP
jgi:hypothetical protein